MWPLAAPRGRPPPASRRINDVATPAKWTHDFLVVTFCAAVDAGRARAEGHLLESSGDGLRRGRRGLPGPTHWLYPAFLAAVAPRRCLQAL